MEMDKAQEKHNWKEVETESADSHAKACDKNGTAASEIRTLNHQILSGNRYKLDRVCLTGHKLSILIKLCTEVEFDLRFRLFLLNFILDYSELETINRNIFGK